MALVPELREAVEHLDVARVMRLRRRRGQSRIEMPVIGVDGDDSQPRALPEILMLDFGHRDVELVPEPGLQAAQRLPLVLERPRPREMKIQSQETNNHVL